MVNKTDTPYTFENSSNPWLMDPKDISDAIEIDGNKITAAYLWSLDIEKRKECLEKVFDHYRKKGFPYLDMSFAELDEHFKKLCKKKSSDAIKDMMLSNSGNLCIDVCQHFCKDLFWKATGDGKSLSPEEVFYNDELFRKVLRNRMGWNTTSEDGIERPYMFMISDTAIRNGLKNSGLAREVSNFRPLIAKYMYEEAAKILGKDHMSVFDYSAGWGARALGAISLGYEYTGTDPLTHNNINDLIKHYGVSDKSNVFSVGSESERIIEIVDKHSIDCCGSCPPYFTMERYSSDNSQCYNEFSDYELWLERYWRPTVKNCNTIMKNHAVFELVIKDKYDGHEFETDMCRIIEEELDGELSKKVIPYKTVKNHLSGKKKSGSTMKSNEKLIIYERIC